MMRRAFLFAAAIAILAGSAAAADLKEIKSQKAGDLAVTLLSESGHWKRGRNTFVLEVTKDGKPVDAGKVALTATMPMAGMAPMNETASLKPDTPGRYRGTINFPDTGERQVTVTWDGPAGKGSTKFAVPIR